MERHFIFVSLHLWNFLDDFLNLDCFARSSLQNAPEAPLFLQGKLAESPHQVKEVI